MGRKSKAPLVDDKGLHLPEGGIIELGTSDWLEWLKTANSFRFECMTSTEIEGTRFSRDLAVGFTAFRTGSSKEYWNAQKRVDRVLRNEYLGRHDEITYELLRSAALKISDKHYWERRRTQQGASIKSVPEDCKTIQTTQSVCITETQEEVAKLKAEIDQLKEEKYDLDFENSQLREEVEKLKKQSLAVPASLAEAKEEILRLLPFERDNDFLRAINQDLKEQLATVTQSSELSVDTANLFNQLRPLLDRLSSRERRAVQQKLEEILG